MRHAVSAGLAYGAIAFAAGFALGTVRVLWVAPNFGPIAATLLELPLMLAISWFLVASLIAWSRLDAATAPRVIMGLAGLVLLLALETGVGLLLFGRSLADQLAEYWTAPAQIGLLAQLVFAAIPWLQGRLDR